MIADLYSHIIAANVHEALVIVTVVDHGGSDGGGSGFGVQMGSALGLESSRRRSVFSGIAPSSVLALQGIFHTLSPSHIPLSDQTSYPLALPPPYTMFLSFDLTGTHFLLRFWLLSLYAPTLVRFLPLLS